MLVRHLTPGGITSLNLGSKGVGTPRVPFLIYARYQPVPAQTKVVGTRSVATTLDSWLGNILTSMPFITTP